MSNHKANPRGKKELAKKGSAKAKPDRRALLEELESIRASLTENTETLHAFAPHITATSNSNNLLHNDQSNGDAASRDAETQIKSSSTKTDNDNGTETPMPAKPDDASASTRKTLLAGQQSLFDQDHPNKNQQDEIHLENPFLPEHVKQRLAREKQHYLRDLETIAKMSFGLKNEETVKQCEALVNELVNRYLPKIEAELRAELHRLIESEHEHS